MSSTTLAPAFHPVRRPAQPTYRLTRRGRLVVFLASLTVVLAIGLFLGAASMATDEAGTPEPVRVVQVAPGDTLWGIAGELAADGEVRAMIRRIEDLNQLESGVVYAGQKLYVPAGQDG